MLELLIAYLCERVGLPPRYQAYALDERRPGHGMLIRSTRLLALNTLLRHKALRQETIDLHGGIEGYLHQESHHIHSQYFCVVDKRHPSRPIVATRLLIGDRTLDNLRQPLKDMVSPHMFGALLDFPEGAVAELGNTSKEAGVSQVAVMAIMREVLGWSSANGVQIVVSGIRKNLWDRAYSRFYGGAMTRMSSEDWVSRISGLAVVPIWLHVPTVLTNRAADIRYRSASRIDYLLGQLILAYYSLDKRLAPNCLEKR